MGCAVENAERWLRQFEGRPHFAATYEVVRDLLIECERLQREREEAFDTGFRAAGGVIALDKVNESHAHPWTSGLDREVRRQQTKDAAERLARDIEDNDNGFGSR